MGLGNFCYNYFKFLGNKIVYNNCALANFYYYGDYGSNSSIYFLTVESFNIYSQVGLNYGGTFKSEAIMKFNSYEYYLGIFS